MAGLYMVLWGKIKEQRQPEIRESTARAEGTHGELEMPNAVAISVKNKELDGKV